jgi:colicin import membrane protein
VAQVMVAEAETFRRREFRRLVTISLVCHGVAFLIFIWDPIPRRLPAMPTVVEVQFVSLPDAATKATAPAAVAKPKPKPLPPVAKKVVLPAKPKPVVPKPKPAPKPESKPEPKKPEPKPEVKPEPKPEAGYDDVLAQLRAKHGETAVKPKPQAAPVEVAATGTVGARLSPEEAAWRSRLRIHLRQSWVLAPGFRLQSLATQVRVRLDAQGRVVGEPRVERGSGNPWYDDSTIRAVQKASPLPAPPSADTYIIEFRPEDYF